MTEPGPRPLPRSSRTVGALAGILLALAVAGCTTQSATASGTSDTVAVVTTPPLATTATSTAAADPRAVVDQLVDGDGVPFSYASMYPDAYSAVAADCQAWESTGSDIEQLLRGRVAGGTIEPGEIAALRIGVPAVCPQFATAVAAALGGS
jgi:hypothetical protein